MFDLNAFITNQHKISSKYKNATSKSNSNLKDEKTKNVSISFYEKTDIEVCKSTSSDTEINVPTCSLKSVSKNYNSEIEDASSQTEYYTSDEEYMPSEEETECENDLPRESIDIKRRKKSFTVKSVDDGDLQSFTARIEEWKANKRKSTGDSGDQSQNEANDCHEISGGLKIPNMIWKHLYRYQKTGVKWLWELHQIESGGLLGDEMGLGKTVQIIAFLAGLSITRIGSWNGLGPSVIVAPATVLHQWVQHFHQWWPPMRVAVLHNSGSHHGSPESLVKDIHNHHGVIVTTYSGIVQHKSCFETRKWDYVILDEGHKIRNFDTQVSKAVRQIRTPHRIVVTGSPMQNNLQELWSIFDFMSPGLLGTLSAFVDNFANPITQGGYANASKFQETTALSLATTLKNVITPYMLRRTKAEVKEHLKLPEKKEQVLFCNLTDEQKDLYKSFLVSDVVRTILNKDYSFGVSYKAKVLVAITTLRKICNHPDLYLSEVDDEAIDDKCLPPHKEFGFWKKAGKMVVINSLLKIWKKQGHRALIFTQSRGMIYILELFLQQNNYKYLKMDGSVSIGSRQPLVTLFNNDDQYLVFLATTRVGGLGVNLTGADRVIIYDPDWNPAIDGQAKERAWRIGQNREVTVYRLLSAGTVEEKIYQRQVFKHLLGNKVFLDPNQKNYLKTSSLQGLFSLEEPDKTGTTETTSIFKHTQINIERPNMTEDETILNGGVSFSKTKLDAMRRLAQQISKSIVPAPPVNPMIKEDPRERYKKSLLPPPPPPEPLAINVINDVETNVDFSSVMSEIEVVSMCTNAKRHKILEFSNNEPTEDGEIVKDDIEKPEFDNDETQKKMEFIKYDSKPSTSKANFDKNKKNIRKEKIKNNTAGVKGKKHKRKHLDDLLKEEEGLLNDDEFIKNVQRVKRRKCKEEPEASKDSDQYVLEKLFAKGVQSALQHDKVVGLAEREERHNMQTAAQKLALRALRNLKKSRLRNWRW